MGGRTLSLIMKLMFLFLLATSTAMAEEHRIFYCDYRTDECIDSGKAIPMERRRIVETADAVLTHQKNFIGLKDKSDRVLQMYVDGPNEISVDMPNSNRKGSYQRTMSKTDALRIIAELENSFDHYEKKLKLVFRKW